MELSEVDTKIKERHEFHQRFTEYVEAMRGRASQAKLKELAEFREFPLELLEQLGVFWVGDMAEMLLPEYLGSIKDFGIVSETNNKPIFHERWAIPIRDTNGLVQNLVGYSPNFDERYIYGTGKYYSRPDTLWGLESLELAYEKGYAVLTEGITDAIRLRSLGIDNAFGRCGTLQSELVMRQLSRCRYGVIFIHDRDDAGDKTRKHWKATKFIRLNTYVAYKDSDEMLRDKGNLEWFMSYFNEAVRRLTETPHLGVKCELECLTMV